MFLTMYLLTALSLGTKAPLVSHLTRLTCPLAPAGLFLPVFLRFFVILPRARSRLMRPHTSARSIFDRKRPQTIVRLEAHTRTRSLTGGFVARGSLSRRRSV